MRPSKCARITFLTSGISTGKAGESREHATHYLVVGCSGFWVTMSERSITRQQAGLGRRAKTSCRNLAISMGPALVTSSLCREEKKRTMRAP